MSWWRRMRKSLGRSASQAATGAFAFARHLPGVEEHVERELSAMLAEVAPSLRPYREEAQSFTKLPVQGLERAEVLAEIKRLADREHGAWREGYASGAVYHGDPEHIEFLNQVYALHSQSNPLHADLWPSASKYEAEIVAMTATLLGIEDEPVGTVTSGGTESILMAMKSYRDQGRAERGIKRARIVAPETAHAAFDKAAQYFAMELVRVPVAEDHRADLKAMARAINERTVVIVGSSPTFPHGVIDPIEELSELARERGIGFHTDACLGGFLLPWAERLGYPVPRFDFRLPGVTSVSVDTHKYGYAAKGTSVILYRDSALRHFQYYTTEEWPGGLYFSPTMAGSRSGALSAACWAAMVSIGESGYMDAARGILETAARLKREIASIDGLRLLSDPLWVIAFTSDELDIYRVMERMSHAGWSLNGLHKPICVHLCVTLRHAQPKVADRFIADLQQAVRAVRDNPEERGSMAPVYGMAATMPVRGLVSEMLRRYLDLIYRV